MGIFASRPEEPFEWAGLPSEPADPESEAEKLMSAGVDASGWGGAVESIVIPVAQNPEIATSQESGEGDDGDEDA
jgi:hypothetical protein